MPRTLKNWLKAYMDYTAPLEAPDTLHFWTGVSTLAAVLQRKVWIDEHYFQWTPNFYIILVGPPGIVAKSTTMSVGQSLLEEAGGVYFGPDSFSWQSMPDAFRDSRKRLELVDGTLLPMSPITCCVSELGTFLNPRDQELVSFLIDVWDGKLTTKRRRTRMHGLEEVENPWINVIGCTTPSWLQDNMPPVMVGGGLTSRILFVYANKKRHLNARPSKMTVSPEMQELRVRLVADLQHIDETLIGPYELDAEADAWVERWYAELWGQENGNGMDNRYEGYKARKQTHLMKLSMVLAASRRDDLLIKVNDLEQANTILNTVEGYMTNVFDSIGAAPSSRFIDLTCSFIKAFEAINHQDLWKLCMRQMSQEDFKASIEGATQAGMISTRSEAVGTVYRVKEY